MLMVSLRKNISELKSPLLKFPGEGYHQEKTNAGFLSSCYVLKFSASFRTIFLLNLSWLGISMTTRNGFSCCLLKLRSSFRTIVLLNLSWLAILMTTTRNGELLSLKTYPQRKAVEIFVINLF